MKVRFDELFLCSHQSKASQGLVHLGMIFGETAEELPQVVAPDILHFQTPNRGLQPLTLTKNLSGSGQLQLHHSPAAAPHPPPTCIEQAVVAMCSTAE